MLRSLNLGANNFLLHPSGALFAVECQWLILATPSDAARQPALFEPETTEEDALKAVIAEVNPALLVAMVDFDNGETPDWLSRIPVELTIIGQRHLAALEHSGGWLIRVDLPEGQMGVTLDREIAEADIGNAQIRLPYFSAGPT